MREKDLGIWRGISWREYGDQAKRVGLGLVALGLRPVGGAGQAAEHGVVHRMLLGPAAGHVEQPLQLEAEEAESAAKGKTAQPPGVLSTG